MSPSPPRLAGPGRTVQVQHFGRRELIARVRHLAIVCDHVAVPISNPVADPVVNPISDPIANPVANFRTPSPTPSHAFASVAPPHTRGAVLYVAKPHAHWMLIDACNGMLCYVATNPYLQDFNTMTDMIPIPYRDLNPASRRQVTMPPLPPLLHPSSNPRSSLYSLYSLLLLSFLSVERPLHGRWGTV